MRRLYTFPLSERPLAALFRQMLEKEGVACLVRNEQLAAAMGEIPLIECFPELWVIDDEVYPRAHLLLKGWLENDAGGPWTCGGCGESHEGQFGACWRCGEEKK